MKLTEKQVRRIIREELAKDSRKNRKALSETRDHADQNLKAYQDGYHGGAHVGVEEKLEDAVHSTVIMFMELNGVSEAEAEQMVMDSIKDIIARTR